MVNKYLSDDEESVESEDIDIHEIVRTHNLAEVKEAISRDRPRLVALKDSVSQNYMPSNTSYLNVYFLDIRPDELLCIMQWKQIESESPCS